MTTEPDLLKATRMAYKCLIALHIEKLPIEPLMILSYCRNTVVHPYSELRRKLHMSHEEFKMEVANGRDACAIHDLQCAGKRTYEVLYDDEVNPFRTRFTLAHELGHVILKHEGVSDVEEREANVFASRILCPLPLVEHLRSSGIELSPDICSRIFDLSSTAARIALKSRETDVGEEISEEIVKLMGEAAFAKARKFKKAAG